MVLLNSHEFNYGGVSDRHVKMRFTENRKPKTLPSNRLIQMEHPSGDITTYAYNGDGLRVLQSEELFSRQCSVSCILRLTEN